MKIKLKPTYSCLVKVGENFYDLDENDILEIENEERILVYPISYDRRNIPFFVDLNSLKDSIWFSVHKIEDETLVLLNKTERIKNFFKENMVVAGENCEILISLSSLKFENKKMAVECEIDKFQNYRVFQLENFLCVEFDSNIVYAFDVKNGRLLRFKGDEIEFEKNLLKTKSNLGDAEDRRKSCVYKFDGDNVLVENCEFSYGDLKFADSLTPYRFLDAIKAKDFSFAKKFLGGKLGNIDENELQKFLPNVKEFYPLSTSLFVVYMGGEKLVAKFILDGGVIQDISINNL